MAIDDNIFNRIEAYSGDPKVALGRELVALRVSVETNARILRSHITRLKAILAEHGVDGTAPLFNTGETETLLQVIRFLIYGGGDSVMAKVDGEPFEGMAAIVAEAKTLVT